MFETLKKRRGVYPTYKGVLIATDSKQREQMLSLAAKSADSLINLPIEGGDSAIFTLGDKEVKTSVVKHTLLGTDLLKFWTESGTYYCFQLKFR